MFEPYTSFFARKRAGGLRAWRREIVIALLAAGSGWLLLSLLTFDSTDPSLFNYVVPLPPVMNWGGMIGSHCAAFLYYFFGNSVWLMLLSGWYMVPQRWEDARAGWRRCAMTLCSALIAGSSLCQLSGIAGRSPLPGGLFGYINNYTVPLIGVAGTALVAGGLLFVAIARFLDQSIATSLRFSWDLLTMVTLAALRLAAASVRSGWAFVMAPAQRRWQWLRKNTILPAHTAEPPVAPDLSQSLASSAAPSVLSAAQDEVVEYGAVQEERTHDELSLDELSNDNTDEQLDELDELLSRQDEDMQEDDTVIMAEESDDEAVGYFDEDSYYTGAEQEDASDELADEYEEDEELAEELFADDSDNLDDEQDVANTERDDRHEQYEDDNGNNNEEDEEDDSAEQEAVISLWREKPYHHPDIQAMFNPPFDEDEHREEFYQACEERGRLLEEKLAHFGVRGKVVAIRPGPVITVYEYEPDPDSKISKITALEDDLALSLRALSIRIIAPVPGKNVVGFEIANEKRSFVSFTHIATENRLRGGAYSLPLALGVNTTGEPVLADLAKMPHLLVAGATGSGKSVGMNVMLVSLLCSLSPDDLRVVLIDPKRLEFAPYADIPHLLFPIITNPHEVSPVLKWVVQEMERRYDVMAKAGVRNVAAYHNLDRDLRAELERKLEVKGMPYMVIMVDELADLMMVAGKEIEMHIARIAQMARAAGIHMIVATQRPSVDVVTGIIKVNFPSRLAYRVSSKVDSRTIVDSAGAEKLLGKGDMLYMSPATATLQRLHAPFIADEEINNFTQYLRNQRQTAYLSLQKIVAKQKADTQAQEWDDPLYEDVCNFLQTIEEVSISLLQRKYRVGFNRSARIIEMLERDGYVAPAQGSKPRRVLKDD